MKIKGKILTATEFKAKCLKLLDYLDPKEITITKRGRPIARVIPLAPVDHRKLYGCLKAKISIRGNVFLTGRRWNAQS
jgi:prevent-host-death family protein